MSREEEGGGRRERKEGRGGRREKEGPVAFHFEVGHVGEAYDDSGVEEGCTQFFG
jgi:hypothetical protein